jgi:hypothetical protein
MGEVISEGNVEFIFLNIFYLNINVISRFIEALYLVNFFVFHPHC